MQNSLMEKPRKKITWSFNEPDKLLKWKGVHTVCEESACPNRAECSRLQTATFLIGGKYCTRNCAFCLIETGKPLPVKQLNSAEKQEILNAVEILNLKYAVITSVTRDDDPEGLAWHFAEICKSLKQINKGVELLIPDFKADDEYLKIIGDASPDVVAHNMETIDRLSHKIRPQASYKKSLQVLQYYRGHYPKILVKTGFMTGLGETRDEVVQLIRDLHSAGAQILTIGQYLQPGKNQVKVEKYYSEQEFKDMKEIALEIGIPNVESGYFIRSSYKAESYAHLK